MSPANRALILLVAVLVLVAAAVFAPVLDWLASALLWIDEHRRTAWLVFLVAYVVATVLLVPGTFLTLGAGLLFGLPVGIALVSVSSILGATAAFLTGRFFARDWISERLRSVPRFGALDRATRHEGFLVVLLVRLSPLFPFSLTNYALGLTAVRLRDYFFASWIGMLPGTVVYVYLGTLALDIASLASRRPSVGSAGTALLIAGFAASVALVIVITRMANRTLKRHLDAEDRTATKPPREEA